MPIGHTYLLVRGFLFLPFSLSSRAALCVESPVRYMHRGSLVIAPVSLAVSALVSTSSLFPSCTSACFAGRFREKAEVKCVPTGDGHACACLCTRSFLCRRTLVARGGPSRLSSGLTRLNTHTHHQCTYVYSDERGRAKSTT